MLPSDKAQQAMDDTIAKLTCDLPIETSSPVSIRLRMHLESHLVFGELLSRLSVLVRIRANMLEGYSRGIFSQKQPTINKWGK